MWGREGHLQTITAPGLYYDLPFSVYRAQSDWVSVSDLNSLLHDPAIYEHRHVNGNRKKPSRAMLIGSGAHALALEPDSYKDAVGYVSSLQTTVGKNERAELLKKNAEAIICAKGDEWIVEGVANAVRNHAGASELLRKGRPEVSFFWIDPDTGVQCKGRADWLDAENLMCPDLKTTEDALSFEKSVKDRVYYRQAAYYLKGLLVLTGEEYKWRWIAASTEAPFLVQVYRIMAEDLELGNLENTHGLRVLKWCRENKRFPSRTTQEREAGLNKWDRARAFARVEKEKEEYGF